MSNDATKKDFIDEFNKKLRFVYLAAAIAFVIYMIYVSITYENINLKYKFRGIVEEVTYDGKSHPSITVNGKIYDLTSNSWNFNRVIERGDSIAKDSGDITVKLIKYKTGKIMIFDGK